MSITREFNALKIANKAQIKENKKIVAERDSLKEQLQKAQEENNAQAKVLESWAVVIKKLEAEKAEAQKENEVFMHGLVEMGKLVESAAYCIDQERQKTIKAEADKAKAVELLKDAYIDVCTQCETFNCEHQDHFNLRPYEDQDKNLNKACKAVRYILSAAESLKGKKGEKLSEVKKPIKCHFCDNEAVKISDIPMCQDCIDDTVY